jgi:brefeldin A-resistance guanine nucleotide exchange factor 1
VNYSKVPIKKSKIFFSFFKCEDFVSPSGHICLIKEENQVVQKTEGTGLFSSFFPFISQDSSIAKGPTPEEQEAIKVSQACVDECHIEQLIHDTKFLRVDSLVELVKALIFLSQPNEHYHHSNDNNAIDLDASIFSLELLIKVILQNRDRISCIWLTIRNHFYSIICNSNEYSFFLERAIVGLQRISVRLLRREELVNEVSCPISFSYPISDFDQSMSSATQLAEMFPTAFGI